MEYYIYDGTLEGLFSGIHDLFKMKKKTDCVELLSSLPAQIGFLERVNKVISSEEKATIVLKWIEETFDANAMERVITAFLSDEENFGTLLYKSLKAAYRLKHREALTHLKNDDIMNFYALYRKVIRLQRLMLGILRFKELESGIYYAYFEPDYNVLPLMTAHFKERLGDQLWVIHDGKRQQAAFFNGSEVFIQFLADENTLRYSEREGDFQVLWQTYFKQIAIKERHNPKCQRSFLPQKYWKFLIEKPQDKH